MSLKYIVKLIHTNGYEGIEDRVGKEFHAIRLANLFFVEGLYPLRPDVELALDLDAVEVVEIITSRDTVEDLCRACTDVIRGKGKLPYHLNNKTS